MDEVMKYFIILLIIIGDPMAVVMVIVFNKIVKRKDDDDDNESNVIKNKRLSKRIEKTIVREKIKPLEDIDMTEELEKVLESDDLIEYDTDVEIEHEDEIDKDSTWRESTQVEKEVINSPNTNEKNVGINIEDIKEIKENKNGLIAPTIKKYNNEVNRIGSNKEVRNGDTNKLYFKKRKDDKS